MGSAGKSCQNMYMQMFAKTESPTRASPRARVRSVAYTSLSLVLLAESLFLLHLFLPLSQIMPSTIPHRRLALTRRRER